jgi:hypothetical protein
MHQEFLDRAPEDSKCVGLDCEYTDTLKNVKQNNFPQEKRQRAAVLQLSVESETLVFQICHADVVPELLREFLNNDAIIFWGAAIHHDVHMLETMESPFLGCATCRGRSPTQPSTIP